MQAIGNTALLDLPEKTAFLSSRKISATALLKCHEWAIKARDGDRCIISGFQSPIEQDVLKFLLRGRAPLILALARAPWAKVPPLIASAVGSGRMLIISPVDAKRTSTATAIERNRWILANSTSLVLGSLDPNGNLAKQIATFPAGRITRLLDAGI